MIESNKNISIRTENNKLTIFEICFCILTFVFMFLWSINQKYNYAPDEYMRYLIPKYIFNYGKLPLALDKEVVTDIWGTSYACFPCQLPAIISAFFMKIVSFFTYNESALLYAARFPNVLAGTLTAYFTIKVSNIIFNRHNIKWIMIIIVSWIPQFIFLSSYVNNDVFGILSSAVIVCSWVYGLKYGWNIKNCVFLSIGIIICALSYQNAYGWILLSGILFILSYLTKDHINKYSYDFLKNAIMITTIVLFGTSYFFIRNAILYNGDFIGIRTFSETCQLYGMDFVKPTNRQTFNLMKKPLIEMLFSYEWIESSYKSFIGVFGYMNVPIWHIIYKIYFLIFIIGIIGLIFNYWKVITNLKDINKKCAIFNCCIIIGIIIPIIFSIYNSYYVDFQPQGRYLYSIIIGLAYFIAMGYKFFILKIKNVNIQNYIIFLFCLLIIIISLSVYFNPFLLTSK